MKTWLGLSIFYKIVDVAVTFYLVSSRGLQAEDSPIVSTMLWAYGPFVGLTVNALIFSLLMWVIYKHKELKLLKISTFLQMIIALTTTAALFIY